MSGIETYKLGGWELQSGETIPDAQIAYKTFGDSSLPVIIYPTWYSGAIADNEWLIGEDKVLNPKKYFIIVTALFGNGQSTSPSNSDIKPFPLVTFYDNVKAQYKLMTEHFGVKHVRAFLGWSMGAGQTYQWATMYPDFMDVAIPFCGAAKTSFHNQVFLESIKGALLAARGNLSAGVCKCGTVSEGEKYRTWTEEQRVVGLKAFGRVYAGWGLSQAFYREKLYETAFGGFKDTGGFPNPENLLVMLYTWQAGDCSQQEPYNGDFKAAMQGIKCKMMVLPGKTDLYFPPEDSEIEVASMKEGVGKMEAYPSIFGHWAGGPGGSPDDLDWLNKKLVEVGL